MAAWSKLLIVSKSVSQICLTQTPALVSSSQLYLVVKQELLCADLVSPGSCIRRVLDVIDFYETKMSQLLDELR